MRFEVLELSLDSIRSLRPLLAVIRRHDPRLGEQIRSAASSVALNIAEGSRRRGKDRQHLWRVAAGSADEVRTSLHVATAWGYLKPSALETSLGLYDSVLAILWTLTH